jgi:hemoglobin/transferrin/lactoferrin receptor protein
LNGSLGLVFNPNLTTQVYVNASTGFRAPNIDDIGKVFESGNGLVVVPNIDLRPEYVYSGEIGFVKSIANKLKIDGAIYYSYLQNALARRNFSYNGQDSILFDGQMSRVQAVQNSANGYVYGVQAGVNWSIWKGLSLRSTISYQVGEEQSADSLIFYPKSHVSPIFGRTSISYQIRKLRFDVYANYNGGVSYANMPLTERQDPLVYAKDASGLPFTPSWITLNAKMGYFPSKYVSIFIGIENITDQLYRTFGSGISAPGRNFIFTLRGTF